MSKTKTHAPTTEPVIAADAAATAPVATETPAAVAPEAAPPVAKAPETAKAAPKATRKVARSPATPKAKAPAADKPAKAPKPVTKPVAKPAKAAAPAPLKAVKAAEKPAAKPAKAAKQKLVRDSFTFPETEYEVLVALKKRLLAAGTEVKKGELVRAGLALLNGLAPAALATAVAKVEKLKTGRPAK